MSNRSTAPVNAGIRRNILVYFIFLVLSMIAFLPVLQKNFASDDYQVLYRIAWQKIFFVRDFFRPLSDISLYSSYLVAGFWPFVYNATNVIIHASCAFLLYRFCMVSNFTPGERRQFFSWSAAMLFLVYPFHNEAVIWVVGRGIVLSGFFGLLAILVVSANWNNDRKYALSCLFYFTGLCGYEAILPVPVIILLLQHAKGHSCRKLLPVAIAYSCTLLLNMVVRKLVSGVIWGSYGSRMFSLSPVDYCRKVLKAAGRIFLPPAQSAPFLTICFLLLVVCITVACFFALKRKYKGRPAFITITLIAISSFVMPAIFGISTKSYEGDRVFYFFSFFLCTWMAYMLSMLRSRKWQLGAALFVSIYFLFFFYQSLLTWRKAGNMASQVINAVGRIEHKGANLYLLNIPEEYNGAQILRNGFTEALLINRVDTSGIRVINYLSTEHAVMTAGLVKPVIQQGGLFIFPAAFIKANTITARRRTEINVNDSVFAKFRKGDKIYYWNKESFILLAPPL